MRSFFIASSVGLLSLANGLAPHQNIAKNNGVQSNGQHNGQTNGFTPLPSIGVNADQLLPMRRGSSCALVTPMHPNGQLDLQSLEQLLQWHLEEGTDNLCILGTTGEANTLSMQEREAVLKTTVSVLKGKIPILAGCGTIDPNHVKEMTMQAMDLGCDASLVVTPYYVKPPQRGLIKHFTDMANLGLPVVVYNVPGRAASNLADDSMAILAQHENIVGLKDATGDLSRLPSLRQELDKAGVAQDSILIYSGDDGTGKDFNLNGGDGCISVTANIAPKYMHEMMKAAHAGDEELANSFDDVLQFLHQDLFCEANPIPVKYAVYRQGRIPSAMCRPPLDMLEPKYQVELDRLLSEAGLLDVDVYAP